MVETVENDPVADSIRTLMDQGSPWEGTASELLLALEGIAGERMVNSKRWPGNASALSRYLKRVVSSLRHTGICVSFLRKRGDGRRKQIIRIASL